MTFTAGNGKSAYDGDGSTVAFPTGFQFVLNSHVKVILRDAGDTEILWAEGSDYSLTGAGNAGGGTVVATTPPASGEKLFIVLDVLFTQGLSLPLGGAFPSTAVERGLDLLAMGLAKLAEVDRRTLKVPETDSAIGDALNLPIDSARAGKFFAFDGLGKPTTAVGTSGSFSPVSSFVDSLLGAADAASFRALIDAMLDAITTRGDLVTGDPSGDPARLAKGSQNRLLGAGASDLGYFGGTVTKTANYTVVAADHRKLILVDASAGPVTITLLALATAGDDFELAVEKIDGTANAVTIAGSGAETIEGAASRSITAQYGVEVVRAGPTDWLVPVKSTLPALTLFFESALQATTAGSLLTLPHGFGVAPKLHEFIFACVTAEQGWSVGDRIVVNPNMSSSATNRGFGSYSDAINVYVRFNPSTGFNYVNKTTGGIVLLTNANWNLIARAWA